MTGGNKAHFAPMPLRAISDRRLSGLDRNVLCAIAAHDLMSLRRGKGRGCDASLATLAGQVGCDYSNCSRSVSKLVDLGFVECSPMPGDKRRHVYRIPAHLYDYAESWSFHQPSAAKNVGHATNFPEAKEVGDVANNIVDEVGQKLGETASNPAKVVGDDLSKNDQNQPEYGPEYIPLNGIKDEINARMTRVAKPLTVAQLVGFSAILFETAHCNKMADDDTLAEAARIRATRQAAAGQAKGQ